MKKLRSGLGLLVPAVLVFGFGCSMANSRKQAASTEVSTAFASPNRLTATLTNGNVLLHWKNNSTADGGNWVEFATPGSEYTKLGVFLSNAGATSYLHPRVAPQTTFLYRINPFFGRASKPVKIITGISTTSDPSLEQGPIASSNPVSPGKSNPRYSLRDTATFAKAAPGNLTATLSSPTSVDLHWQDRASDEDGYLLEIGASANGEFHVCALIPPNTTSFRKTGLPSATTCYFRVRAYFYGKPSEVASVWTSAR